MHPKRSRARVLLTSVYGPYARDDEDGSRAINPMELYHNQVTRLQGVFSLRMFHRSWGLMLIQSNISAPCWLLDFPTLDRFDDELRARPYDVVGISSILANVGKVKRMCRLVRQLQPQATIVVGGHIANRPDLGDVIDADHIVRGEGVAWFRRFLGEDDEAPIRHPLIQSGHGGRTMGVPLSNQGRDTAATVIPSVGCPLGCNFCSTSAMFGGKGRHVSFYETGDELFDILCRLEAQLHVRSFFVMDENFLLHRKRARRLLELIREHGKPWAFYVFSSANTVRLYGIDELVELGVSWLWLGLEGKDSRYSKLHGTDTRSLVRELQANGIRVLGSSIIGLPEHTPHNIDAAIDHAVAYDTEFHQFMLYTPLPGTPLHAEHARAGTLLDEEECAAADAHGQLRFNYRHPSIPPGRETDYLLRAFERDFEVNGPSLLRIARTMLRGWRRHKDHPDPRVRARFRWECRDLSTAWAAAARAMAQHPGLNPEVAWRARKLEEALVQEFGVKARLSATLGGRFVARAMRREEARLAAGWTYEPPTFYEANAAALLPDVEPGSDAVPCDWVAAGASA